MWESCLVVLLTCTGSFLLWQVGVACMYNMLYLHMVEYLELATHPHVSLLLTPLHPPHPTPSSSPSSPHSLLLTPLPPHPTPSSSLHSLLLTPFCSMHSSTSGSLFLPCRAVWLSGGVDDSWYDHINSTVPHRYCSADCNLFLLSWEQI